MCPCEGLPIIDETPDRAEPERLELALIGVDLAPCELLDDLQRVEEQLELCRHLVDGVRALRQPPDPFHIRHGSVVRNYAPLLVFGQVVIDERTERLLDVAYPPRGSDTQARMPNGMRPEELSCTT